MKIYHIAAISENNVIGQKGKLPWDLKEDLQRFKQITCGHPVIMGRKTFESLGEYRPLPHRRNIVLTTQNVLKKNGQVLITKREGLQKSLKNSELAIAEDIPQALSYCSDRNEVFIIGGESVYKKTLNLADELRITVVHQEIEGDAFYPELDKSEWIPSFVEPHGTHTYIDYVRKSIR